MSKAQPKLSELREFYAQAVAYTPEEQVHALRQVVKWYDTKAAFVPMTTVGARFNKLRELVLNNPGVNEALSAAERIIPEYEKHFLSGVKNAPSLAAVKAEIKAKEKDLKAKHDVKVAEERQVVESTAPLVAALNQCFGAHTGLSFRVAGQQKVREYSNGVVSLGLHHATELAQLPVPRALLSLVDYVCKAVSYDTAVGKISSAQYVAKLPALLAGIDKWFDGGSEQPGSASFQFLKRARSDKAKLIGERYRPYTYQAIVWQRLYQANGEWVLKTALTAGLDTPWPHRIPIHLQKDGERGGRWKVDIEKTRVRMTDVKVTANLPEEEKKQ